MKKLALTLAVSAAAVTLSQAALADRVKGSAKADFQNDEMQVPCVLIENYSAKLDGKYFDIILKRRGNALNYELTFAEPEDATVCEDTANYAAFVDDDPVDDTSDDSADDDSDDDSDDAASDDDNDSDDSSDDDAVDVANLFASCTVHQVNGEPIRSRVKVKAKDLADGEYYAVVTSGDTSAQSDTYIPDDDELEIEFDSDSDEVESGKEIIDATFIVDASVLAEVVDASTDETILSETVSCRVKE